MAVIFKLCAASASVTDLLGVSPTRLFPFGEAPPNVAKPYAVWQVIGGSPINVIDGPPNADRTRIQVDIYGETGESVAAVAAAIRSVIARRAYVTGFNVDGRDPDTKSYRKSFDVDWIVDL